MRLRARRAAATPLQWAWEALRDILKGMVTSAVKTAWGILAGTILAFFAGAAVIDVASGDMPSTSPLEVADDVKAIGDGLTVLVEAADFYLKSNGQ